MIWEASSVSSILRYDVSFNHFLIRQLISSLIGYGAGFFIIVHINTKYYKWPSILGICASIILLLYIFVSGKIAGGARSWYDLGSYSFQPIEFAKISLILFLSWYYHRISLKKNITFGNMFFPLIGCLIIVVSVFFQPDLGGSILVSIIVFAIFCSLPIAKVQKKRIYGIIAFGVLGLSLFLLFGGYKHINKYQINRVISFRNPCQRYREDTGYQVCNGYIAIHNGGLFGVGLGNSTQKYLYLPEAHTDFIYPIIVEELGALVAILVVIGYFVFLYIILNVAKETDNLRNSILAYGIFAYFTSHILVNLLGVLGLIPLTGVPLPFLSYGGTYNVFVVGSFFIIQRINIENKEAKKRKIIEEL